jgi:hypothetical protein
MPASACFVAVHAAGARCTVNERRIGTIRARCTILEQVAAAIAAASCQTPRDRLG